MPGFILYNTNDGAVYGIGATVSEMFTDATQWLNSPDEIDDVRNTAYEVQFGRTRGDQTWNYGPATDALIAHILANGGCGVRFSWNSDVGAFDMHDRDAAQPSMASVF